MATNPYQFDPFLQQAFGNLSNALLGSASNDADIALGTARKAQAENSLAAALSNKALARGRNAEAENLEMINANALALSKNPQNQSRLLGQLYPNLAPVPGASTGFMAENVLQNALRATSANDIALAETNFTRNQQAIKRSNLIESLITSGDPLKMRQGFVLANNDPGEYFDSGFAQEKDIRADDTDRFKITQDNKTTSAKDRMANETAKYEIDEKNKLEREKPIITTAAPGETVKIYSDGEVIATHTGIPKTVTMNVPDGSKGFAVMPNGDVKEFNNERDPEAYIIPEDAIGFVPNDFGGWTKLQGNRSTTKVVGSPGQTINILDSNGNVLKEIVVENNPTEVKANAGQTVQLLDSKTQEVLHTLEGRDTTSTSSSGGDRNNISTADDNLMLSVIDSRLNTESPTYERAFNKVPEGVMNFLRNEIVTKATIDLGNQNGKSGRLAAQDALRPYLRGDVVMSREGFDFGIPAYMYEFARNKISDGTVLETGSNGEQIEVPVDRDYIISSFVEVNYTYKQASKIADMLGL